MSDALVKLIAGLAPEKRAILADLLQPASEPIAVIGMACRFPGDANTPDAFWELLRDGKDTAVEVPAERWDIDAYYDPDPDAPGKMYTRYFGFLREVGKFDSHFFDISPREAMRMDPQQQLLLEVAWEAFENAGQTLDKLAGSQTGVFIGITDNNYTHMQAERGDYSACMNDPYFMVGTSSSIASGRFSYSFDLKGPRVALDTDCSPALVEAHL